MKIKPTATTKTELPPSLEAYAWNIPRPLSEWGRASVALEALETANERLWKKVPSGWFNIAFAKRHGRAPTRRLIAEIRRLRNKPWPRYPKHK